MLVSFRASARDFDLTSMEDRVIGCTLRGRLAALVSEPSSAMMWAVGEPDFANSKRKEFMMLAAPVATSLTVLEMAQAGRFAEIHDLLAPQLRPMVTAEALQAAWAAELGRRGPVSSVGAPVSEPAGAGGGVVR